MQRDHICLNPIFEGIEIKPFFGGGQGFLVVHQTLKDYYSLITYWFLMIFLVNTYKVFKNTPLKFEPNRTSSFSTISTFREAGEAKK